VAKEIELQDSLENMGAQMVRESRVQRPRMWPVTARPPQPCWPRRFSAKAFGRLRPVQAHVAKAWH